MNTRFILFILLIFTFYSCKKSEFPGYDRAESGLFYRFLEKKDGKVPAVNDYVILRIAFRSGDSILFSSSTIPVPYRIQLPKPLFKGDFFEAIAMMGEGDSASFIIHGDSLFLKELYSPAMRQGVDSTRCVVVDIRLVKVQTLAEIDREQKSHSPRERELLDKMKAFEPEYINEYIIQKKIKEKPAESGLYFIPSSLAYGEEGAGQAIPPYTPLLFEIEMINIK